MSDANTYEWLGGYGYLNSNIVDRFLDLSGETVYV